MSPPPLSKIGFLLAPFAFEEVYGLESVRAIEAFATVCRPIATREDLAFGRVPWLSDIDFLFTGWGAPTLESELLKRMPRLRAVFFGAGSVRDLVTEDFWSRDIALTSAAAVNAQPVAEYTLGAVLLSLKRVFPQAATVRRLRGYPTPPMAVPGAFRSTVGVVSFGQIARQLCEHLRRFDLRMLVHDPFVPLAELEAAGVEPATLEQIFAESDVVSLHTPWLPSTEGLITGALLRRLKPGATLINTARGAIVREDELAAVFRERSDLQAILDVTWPEPPAADSPLYDLPNVAITPHIAGSIGAERRRIGLAMIDELQRFLRGDPLRFAVRREQCVLQA